MSEPERCSNCDRSVRLRSQGPKGRICSNCAQILGALPCGTCGELRRVAGRDGAGRPQCERCKARVEVGRFDAACRVEVLDAVARADPTFGTARAEPVLVTAVESTRSLRRLARVVRSDPEVLIHGPTSHPPVLDRFVRALVAAGADLATIYPHCSSCGRLRPLEGSGLCRTCAARNRKETCSGCGRLRRVNRRGKDGSPRCWLCVQQQHRHDRLGELSATIAAEVTAADGSLRLSIVEEVVCRIAPTMPARVQLADLVTDGGRLDRSDRRAIPVAHLLAELRKAGSTLPAARCEECSAAAEPLVTVGGMVRCRHCARRCPGCGAFRKEPERLRCRACAAGRTRGTCADCERGELVLDEAGRCRECRKSDARGCSECDSKERLTDADGRPLCYRCLLGRELDELFASAKPDLGALRGAILGAGNAFTTRRWLTRTSGGRLLTSLLRSDAPITHEALDAASGDNSVEHLRGLLVATGVLLEEDRSVERFEERFRLALAEASLDPADGRVARSWLRWSVLARLRRSQENGQPMMSSVANALNQVRQVVRFLELICERGRNLASLTQADVDEWFALPGALPTRARPFLVWAQRRHHVPDELDLPPAEHRTRREVGDDATRWALARRVVVDDDLAADVRLAAALVLLYGQPLARIARLARGGVHRSADGTTVLDLDGHPLPIHEPFASLVEQLPLRRQHGVRDQPATDWLFPGANATRHVAPSTLGRRLRELGIEPRLMRNTARAQLAAEIPASLLSEIIGITPNTAVAWANRAAGNWATYAAHRANSGAETIHH